MGFFFTAVIFRTVQQKYYWSRYKFCHRRKICKKKNSVYITNTSNSWCFVDSNDTVAEITHFLLFSFNPSLYSICFPYTIIANCSPLLWDPLHICLTNNIFILKMVQICHSLVSLQQHQLSQFLRFSNAIHSLMVYSQQPEMFLQTAVTG